MSTGETERQRIAELQRQRLARKVEFLDARLAELMKLVQRLDERIDRLTSYIFDER